MFKDKNIVIDLASNSAVEIAKLLTKKSVFQEKTVQINIHGIRLTGVTIQPRSFILSINPKALPGQTKLNVPNKQSLFNLGKVRAKEIDKLVNLLLEIRDLTLGNILNLAKDGKLNGKLVK